MIGVRVIGITDVVGTLQPIAQGEPPRRTILKLSQVAFDSAQRGAGKHTKTGSLFQSLYNRATGSGRAVGHDPDRAPHAFLVNFGSRPHVIKPKSKKMLRFPVGGRFVFARAVRHPGYRGDPYMVNAATEAIQQFATLVNAAFKEST